MSGADGRVKGVRMLAENPFASQRVRPGALEYLFREGESAAQLLERLRASGGWGQIIGPHGSGKSTLLHTLMPALREAGRDVIYVRFQGGKLAGDDHERRQCSSRSRSGGNATQVIIDGYEQLSWLAKLHWKWLCRRRGWGLLVTAHRDVGLPPLYESHVDFELAQRVVGKLLDLDRDAITCDEVGAALQANEGNLRDALFQLYDVYEQRRRANLAQSPLS